MAGLTAKDLRGVRGEALFVTKIMDFCGRDVPYFDPHFLGDKFPVFDHIVNVVDGAQVEAFFFAQVKTTSGGYETRRDGKQYLKVQVSRADLGAMFQYPGPAYLFGVDERNGSVYVVAVDRERLAGFSAMPTDFEIDCDTLRRMWDEVKVHWAGSTAPFKSRFSLE